MHSLAMVVGLIALSFAFQELFRFLRLPRVIAQILVGILIGLPPLRGLWFDPANAEILEFLAQIGIVLLFFFSGLEISLKQFVRNIPTSFRISLFNTALPLAAGFLLSKQFGLSDQAAAVVGVSLGISAATFSIDLLEEMNLLKSRLAQTIISAATVDDVLELVLITFLFAVIHEPGAASNLYAVATNFAALLLAFLFFRQILAPKIIELTERESHAMHLTAALLITLTLAVIAEALGFGILVGAMFGGILVRHILMSGALRKPWEEHQLAESVHTFAFGLFVPMFFIWVGFNTQLSELAGNWWLGVLFAVITTVGTVLGTAIGALLSGKSAGEGVVIGLGVNGKGDVELVIAALAKQLGVISTGVFSALVLMAVLTMFVSPLLFRFMVKRCGPELLKEGEINARESAGMQAA